MADEHTLADGLPREQSRDALNTSTQKMADKPTMADGPPTESRMDTLNTATPNLADEHTLADGPHPPGNQAEIPSILVHTTWQTNLLWVMDPPMPNGNFTLLLTSTGQEWQFHIATDI